MSIAGEPERFKLAAAIESERILLSLERERKGKTFAQVGVTQDLALPRPPQEVTPDGAPAAEAKVFRAGLCRSCSLTPTLPESILKSS